MEYPEVTLVGDSNSLINLVSNDAKIIKSHNPDIGKTSFDVYGNVEMMDVSLSINVLGLPINASTENKEFPFPGNFDINVKSGANLIVDLGIKLLPGARVTVDEGAQVRITNNGRIAIYDANEYVRGITTLQVQQHQHKELFQPTLMELQRLPLLIIMDILL